MKATEFCYWLQGVFEVAELRALDEKQTAQIRAHLALVFQHDIDPKQVAESLQKIHDSWKNEGLNPNRERTPPVRRDHVHPGDVLLRC